MMDFGSRSFMAIIFLLISSKQRLIKKKYRFYRSSLKHYLAEMGCNNAQNLKSGLFK